MERHWYSKQIKDDGEVFARIDQVLKKLYRLMDLDTIQKDHLEYLTSVNNQLTKIQESYRH